MEVQLKRWKLNKCATLPTCNSLLQVPFLFWLLEGAGAKISKVLVLVFMFDALVAIFRSSLLWFLDALCSFIVARMRVGLSTELRTCGCIAQFWWQLVLGRFAHTTQTCKGLFFFKRTFFCWGPSGRRTEISVQLDPSEPKGLFPKKRTFFSRPSVHPSKLFQQLAPQDQGEWMCSNPVYISHKCRNVQMFAPAANYNHYKKQAKVFIFRHELWIQSCSAMKF